MSTDAGVVAQLCGIDGFGLPLDGVNLVAMPPIVERILGSHVQAITITHTILFNSTVFGRVVEGSEPELLAHELIHVDQWSKYGVAGFVWIYTRDYLRVRLLGGTHRAAYRSIGFEYQAYTGAARISRSLS